MTDLALPKMALYYNLWKNFENKEVSKLFTQTDLDSVAKLKPDQVVWIDEDPIYHHGKVYGYVRRVVTSIEEINDDKVRLNHNGGMTTVTREGYNNVHLLNNPEKLVEMVREDERIGSL